MIKTAKQLKDLIRNLYREKSADAQILMRNYMMERFLERISLSEYRDKFILKGGMLVAAMVGLDARSTHHVKLLDLACLHTAVPKCRYHRNPSCECWLLFW